MSKPVEAAMMFEDMGTTTPLVSSTRRAKVKQAPKIKSDNINDLDTLEIFGRVYRRHIVGIWQTLAIVPWLVVLGFQFK